jgi:hypothetical protein
MKRIAVMLMVLAFVATSAFADAADAGRNLSVRTFQFKHKQAEKAAAMIKPILGAGGTMSIQPSTNSLVVTDDPESLKKIAEALAAFDAPAQPFQLTVRLVTARRGAGDRMRVPSELKELESKLAMLRYNEVDNLGFADVASKEGQPGTIDLASYRADFKLGEYDPASDTIQITDFRLSRLDGDQLAPMMKTTLNLKLGQTVIFAVARDAQSQKALMLVLAARR